MFSSPSIVQYIVLLPDIPHSVQMIITRLTCSPRREERTQSEQNERVRHENEPKHRLRSNLNVCNVIGAHCERALSTAISRPTSVDASSKEPLGPARWVDRRGIGARN